MKSSFRHCLARALPCGLLLAPLSAQTEVLYSIAKPDASTGWGSSLVALPDMDGDGIGDLAITARQHGAGTCVWVHSGADGALLYAISEPHVSLFFGPSVTAVGDQNGDGVRELIIVGTHSGAHDSPDGWIQVHSGADGSLLRHMEPPTGYILRENDIIALSDQDGDGVEDVLIRTYTLPGLDSPQLQLYSSRTGLPLYTGVADTTAFLGNRLIHIDDRDGDGVPDFATTGMDSLGSRVDIRSGRTGAVISILRGDDIGFLSGNGEGLVGTPDRDGDGQRDFATGSFFETPGADGLGVVRSFSSYNGLLQRSWVGSGPLAQFAHQLIAPGDLNQDGRDDLLTVEHINGQDGFSLIGLDLGSDGRMFEEFLEGAIGGYAARMIALPGVDPEGFPTFAVMESGSTTLRVRRYAQVVSEPGCTSTLNSTGEAAVIRAIGSSAIHMQRFLLEATQAVPGQFGIFFYGPDEAQTPFGDGFLCVTGGATGLGRLPVEQADSTGRFTHWVDFSAPPTATTQITPGSTWTFQAWFRDPALGAPYFQTSDAATVLFLP